MTTDRAQGASEPQDTCGGAKVLAAQEPGDPRPLYCGGCEDCRPPEQPEARRQRASHVPHRGDDVEAWLTRMRDRGPIRRDAEGAAAYRTINRLLDRYRECADYGLTLLPDDDEAGDP